jgi:DNA repair protein RecO (recombination protein O)
MSVLTSEAVVLRTWPVHEADLIVSFFTRDYGRVKGVAKSALKSRKRFGGALEPMTVARAWFAERPAGTGATGSAWKSFARRSRLPVDHARMAVLSFFAEVLDEALPEHDPQETVFRLLLAVLEQTTVEQPWMPLTYFSLWMTRLMGLLPDLSHCTSAAKRSSRRDQLQYSRRRPVLRRSSQRAASGLSADSWQLAQRMLRAPASAFAGEPWPRRRGQDLRRFTCNRWSGIWSASCAPPRHWDG